MYKFLNYLKYLGLFILVIIGIATITSLINLTGINSSIISKLGVIITAISFFIISALASKDSNELGYILGIKLGILFIIFLVVVNFLVFKSNFKVDRLIYYAILFISSLFGGSFGKNLKKTKAK